MPELLFSYGTLQIENVQLESFGRILKGEKDSLSSYKLIPLEIKDKKVLQQSQQTFHPIAVYTGNKSDTIAGVVFELNKEELSKADDYEVDDYKRIEVKLDSGKKTWVYVSKDNA